MNGRPRERSVTKRERFVAKIGNIGTFLVLVLGTFLQDRKAFYALAGSSSRSFSKILNFKYCLLSPNGMDLKLYR